MISIDQNCHSLWDTVPKLQALAGRGVEVVHYIEDVDVAFTALGAAPGAPLTLDRERYHHSGGAWWGAALFYYEFLGRLAVDPRRWEPMTGMKTAALARRLGRSVEDLYAEFSPSDAWQLEGPSYVGDAEHHRVIGDLTAPEAAPFIRELLDKAQADMRRAFPEPASRARLDEWFAAERARVEALLAAHSAGRLPDLYHDWMAHHLGPGVRLDTAGRLFACGGGGPDLLRLFLTDYDLAAGLYNEAVRETESELRPLSTAKGELPYFAVVDYQGHRARTGVYLDDGQVRVADRTFPLGPDRRPPMDALAAAGVRALPPKAVALVVQVRSGDTGRPLALPHRGSLYVPTVHCFAAKLDAAGLLPGALHPIVRVRCRLLDRMRSLDTRIRLPRHLAEAMGADEVPARRLGEAWADLAAEAAQRLDGLRDPGTRERWLRNAFADLSAEIDALDRQRRQLARTQPPPEQIRGLSRQVKLLEVQRLDRAVRHIHRDWQIARLDYYDSRGALLPWSLALGGPDFYNDLLRQTETHEEPPRQDS